MKKTLRTHGMLLLALLAAATLRAANINVTSDITANTSWTNNNVYILFGDIIIKSGVTLTIQEGTIIRGDKTTLSRLVVAIGGKLIAQGTPEQPIVFTSNQPAGSRGRGDWAGLAVCGLAPVNFKDGGGNSIQGRLECGSTTDYDFGGNTPDDSSGVISYVRIEYAGYICNTNSELNSLTLGGVGSRTKIDHVMVSYGQDDGYEFFGGTVNAKNIISFGSRDDDFDTDNGYSGKVQYGLIIRVDTIADQGDISNAFESDNDAGGTYNDPYTKGVFSNITVVGPAPTTTSTIDAKYGWGARLRRNTGLNIFNSLFMGYKRGLRIESASTQLKATNDTLEFKNNIIAGSKEQYYETAFDSLYLLNQPSNTIFRGNANDTVNLVSPYGNPDQFNFLPQAGSPALSGAAFSNPKLASLENTTYRGAFGSENWTNCWAEFSPNDENYTAGPINYGFTAQVNNGSSLTFCAGDSVSLTAVSSNPNVSYLWSTGATTSAINASSSGVYTVTITTARGCSKSVSKTVTVNPVPATPVITPSATSFCTGSNGVSLSSTSGPNFSWSNGGNTNSINVLFGGQYSVTVSDANQCTAASVPVTITQNTPAVPVITATGSTTFCTGGSVDVVVNNSSNFASYVWSDNSTNDTLTVTATGTYKVTTTDNNNCTSSSNTITTNVSNAPSPTIAANGATTFCSGDSVVISSTAGDTYLWSNNATTQSIVVKASGSYTVTVTNADQCNGVGGSNTIAVSVTPTPDAAFTSAVDGSSYQIAFTNSSTNATSYLWDFGNGQTSTQQAPTHTYTANGNFTVTLTATNGGCTDVSTGSVNIIGVSVEDITSAIESIRLFPNPNNGVATLQIFSNDAETVNVTLTDLSGRVLMNQLLELNSGTNHHPLSTSEYGAGIYLLQISNGAIRQSLRMVVNQ